MTLWYDGEIKRFENLIDWLIMIAEITEDEEFRTQMQEEIKAKFPEDKDREPNAQELFDWNERLEDLIGRIMVTVDDDQKEIEESSTDDNLESPA